MNQPSWMLGRLAGVSILLILMLNSIFVANAQNSSIPPSVKGTWKAYTEIVITSSILELVEIDSINFTYSFDGTGKVSSTSNYSKYNSGTYKVKGNSILIEFPDYFVDATIDGNRMKGVFIDRVDYERSIWAAERISSVSKSERPTSNANRGQTSEQRGVVTDDELKVRATPDVHHPQAFSKDDTRRAVGFLGKADDLARQKKYREAIDNYTMAINLKPNIANLYVARARAKSALNDYRGAIADYNKAIQIMDSREGVGVSADELKIHSDLLGVIVIPSVIYLDRGVAKNRLGDKVGACNDFRKSCSLGFSDGCKASKNTCNAR